MAAPFNPDDGSLAPGENRLSDAGAVRSEYSTDPFEKEFRTPSGNATMEELKKMAQGLDVSEEDLRHLQSKEWAESMRPVYQWKTKLKERGLWEGYLPISAVQSEGLQVRYERLCDFFAAHAPDLLDTFKLYEECRRTGEWGKWSVSGRKQQL